MDEAKVRTGLGIRRGGSSYPVFLITIVAAVAALVSVIFPFLIQVSPLFGLIANLSIFVSTGLISFLVTESNEKVRSQDEARKLADFAARRVGLTADNIDSLIQELADISDAMEMRRLVVFTLRNLKEDSNASLKDIEEMGYVVATESAISTSTADNIVNSEIQTNAKQDQVQTFQTSRSETYRCPTCNTVNSADLGMSGGTTRVVNCSSCGSEANFHRLSTGGTKVVSRVIGRLSGIGKSPLESAWISDDSLDVAATGNCPRCGQNIDFIGKTRTGSMERFCNSCLGNVRINAKTLELTLGEAYDVTYLDELPQSGKFECSCGAEFHVIRRRDDEGRSYFCCFKCKKVFRPSADRKTLVQGSCSTDGCNSPLNFKVDPITNVGKQICYECLTRQEYDKNRNIVKTIEKLDVKSINDFDWKNGNRTCPNCSKRTGVN